MTGPYDDIIHLPHPVSATRTPMPRANRAAQFSPFAALTGYEDAIQEAGRRTDEQVELGEDAKVALDRKLRVLADAVSAHPTIEVHYFRRDGKKDGGAYLTAVGAVKKIDEYEKAIVLTHGEKIAIEHIVDIACELFQTLV